MTGEQLDKYIESIENMMTDMEKKFPDIVDRMKGKRDQLKILKIVTDEERNDNLKHEELSADLNEYSVKVIKNLIIPKAEETYIDYSPLYKEVSKYGLSLSRVCDILGISHNTRNLISKNKLVHLSVLKKIADFLECPTDDLFTFIDKEEHSRRLEKQAFFGTGNNSNTLMSILQRMDHEYPETKGEENDTITEEKPEYKATIPRQARRDKNDSRKNPKYRIIEQFINQIGSDDLISLRNQIVHGQDDIMRELKFAIVHEANNQLTLDWEDDDDDSDS